MGEDMAKRHCLVEEELMSNFGNLASIVMKESDTDERFLLICKRSLEKSYGLPSIFATVKPCHTGTITICQSESQPHIHSF